MAGVESAAAAGAALRHPHGKRYTFQWTTLLIWLYVAEGATRAMTDPGVSAKLAVLEVALALAFFGAAVAYLRSTPPG